jgi:hypothetical protein
MKKLCKKDVFDFLNLIYKSESKNNHKFKCILSMKLKVREKQLYSAN